VEEEKRDKGFTIKDRRIFSMERLQEEPSQSSKGKESQREQQSPREDIKAEKKEGREKEVPLPEVNFSTFIFSLSHSAILHLGMMADPVTQKVEKNLPLAKQTIDILGMLKEKTRGNLTQEEQALLDNILYDLRLRYVKEVSP
jgi:hypothetical protein